MQGMSVRNTNLCTELTQADFGFAALVDERRKGIVATTQQQANQDAQLGR